MREKLDCLSSNVRKDRPAVFSVMYVFTASKEHFLESPFIFKIADVVAVKCPAVSS